MPTLGHVQHLNGATELAQVSPTVVLACMKQQRGLLHGEALKRLNMLLAAALADAPLLAQTVIL